MSFDVVQKLTEIFDWCAQKQFQKAVEVYTIFYQHFIITSDGDVQKLFSTEALNLIFGFLKNKSNSAMLNLLSMLQLFYDQTAQISSFINDNFDIFALGILNNIEEVEIRQFYGWCLLNLQPKAATIEKLKKQIFYMVLDVKNPSDAKFVGEYVYNVIYVISLLPTFKLINDSLQFLQENRLIDHYYGMAEFVPKILKLCQSNEQSVALEFENEVIQQIMDILGQLKALKALYVFYLLYLIQQITYFAFIDQNLQFFKLLDERQFYQKLMVLAQYGVPHIIAFTREMIHFYMQLFQKLCFIPKDIYFAIDQVNEILFLDKTNHTMHQIVEKVTDETAYLTYIQYNGFVPIKLRTSYISMLIICLKEFYVDLNSLAWKYTSLFVKPSPEESRQLVQLNVDFMLYNMLGQFLRYFLLASKPALKLYSNQNFKHENYGKFLLDNVFSTSYSVANEVQNDGNEASDKYVEDTWASMDYIGVRQLRPRKKKEVAKLYKYIGDIPVIQQAFNFTSLIASNEAEPQLDEYARRNQLRLQTSYRKPAKAAKSLSIKIAEPSDSDLDPVSPNLASLNSDSEDFVSERRPLSLRQKPEKLSARVRNSSSSEESYMQYLRFCGIKANSSDDDSDCEGRLTINIGSSRGDKSQNAELAPQSARSVLGSSEDDQESPRFSVKALPHKNSGSVLSYISDAFQVNEAVSMDVSLEAEEYPENERPHGLSAHFQMSIEMDDGASKPLVLKLNNDSSSDDMQNVKLLPSAKNAIHLAENVIDLSLNQFQDEDFNLQKSDSR